MTDVANEDPRRYVCEDCKKRFILKEALYGHRSAHSGDDSE